MERPAPFDENAGRFDLIRSSPTPVEIAAPHRRSRLKLSSRFPCLLAVVAALLAAAAPAGAHPLGNFTINHLVKVDVTGRTLHARYVLDMAEIPTFQAMRERDTDARMDARQLRSWAMDEVAEIRRGLDVEADGRRLALVSMTPHAFTRPGAGGLPTLYWVDDFRTELPPHASRITVRDESFAGRIGWKDVVVAPATEPTDELRHYPEALLGSPREVTSVQMTMTASGARVVSDVTSESTATAPVVSQIKSNALSDMLARGTGNPIVVILTLLAAIGLGALHAAEPGHGKTLLAVSLVGARATPKQALLLAVGLTIAHTAGVLLLGGVLLVAARWIVPEAIYPWITLLSGAAVAVLGATALARFVRARRAAGHHHDGESARDARGQDHDHDRDHAHSHGVRGDAPLSFRGVMLVAMSGNIAPCPAALVVLLAALALHQVAYGLAVVVAFSVGLAAVLTGLGLALVRGAAWISTRPAFDKAVAYAPLASACVISVIGSAMLGQGAAAGAFEAPPFAMTLLALTAIVAFSLSPGHAHVRGHAHAHAHDHGVIS